MRKGRIKLKNCTIAAVSFLAFAVIVFLLLTYTSERKLQPDYEELDDHWEVEINGKQYKNEADHRMYEDKRSMKAELQRENVEK